MNALVRDRKGPSVERHVVERSSFLIIKNKNKNKKKWRASGNSRITIDSIDAYGTKKRKVKKKHTYYSSQVAADLSWLQKPWFSCEVIQIVYCRTLSVWVSEPLCSLQTHMPISGIRHLWPQCCAGQNRCPLIMIRFALWYHTPESAQFVEVPWILSSVLHHFVTLPLLPLLQPQQCRPTQYRCVLHIRS